MSFYDDILPDILAILTEFGQPVSIQQLGPKTTNAAGISVPSNPTPMNTVGVIFDFVYRQYGNEVERNTQIQSADKQLFCYPTIYVPQVQDRVTTAGNTWAIVNIKQINPAGTPLLYELWLKR
jgi:hypothetical protein